MGRYSKKRSSGRGSGRDRERFEKSAGSGLAGGSGRSRKRPDSLGSTSRVAREAEGAKISNTRLAAAKNLDKVPATLLAERDRRKRRIRKNALIVLSAVGILLLAIIAAAGLYYLNLQSRMTVSNADIPDILRDRPPVPVDEPFNLVIFGVDTRDPGREYALTDTIILSRIDPVQNRIWMVSIPRDTRAELPGHGASKINAAYVHGGPSMAIQAVEDVTGQEVHYFMTLNFWGFESIVDAMGGIEINVPLAINDPAADFTPDGRASRIAPGLQTLDGAHALTFVRHRAGYADADIGRVGAQQLFLRAMLSQMTDAPLTQLPGIVNSLADNTKTNFTPIQLGQLGQSMRRTSSDNFYSTTLPGVWRSPFIWIDEAGAAEVWRNFGVRPFENNEGEYEDDEGAQSSSLSPSEITLTVRNGTTTVGLAAQASAVLRARGFVVEDIGNTGNQTVYDENMVIFNDNRQAAELVAQFMPEATRVVQARGMFHFDTEVLVILGSEWDISTVPVADVVTSN